MLVDGPPPILVTGSHRSGSTWVGKMISAHPAVAYIHEPFSVHHRRGICDVVFPYWFPYVCPDNEGPYLIPVSDMFAFRYQALAELATVRSARDGARLVRDAYRFEMARWRSSIPLVKDPIAFFSAEWLQGRYGARVVVLIRHPAAFASSLHKLGWNHPFGDFLAQPLLMRDLLAPFTDEIRAHAEDERDVIDQAILLWNLVHSVAIRYQQSHPGWLFIRHEDLARDPVSSFGTVFHSLNLEMPPVVRRRIADHSSVSNPADPADPGDLRRDSRSSILTWRRRLTEEQIARVRVGTEMTWPAFYGDDDW